MQNNIYAFLSAKLLATAVERAKSIYPQLQSFDGKDRLEPSELVAKAHATALFDALAYKGYTVTLSKAGETTIVLPVGGAK